MDSLFNIFKANCRSLRLHNSQKFVAEPINIDSEL